MQRDYVVDYTSAIKNDLMVYEDGGFKTSYTYGANGRISQMTRHLEDEINPVTGKTISTTPNAKGENINSDIAVEKLGKLYYHLDRLGSTAFITDETGMVRSYATYDEWGSVREGGSHDVNIASIDATASFTTYTYDKILDKYFAQYRMYDAEVKRYTAEDPAKNDLNWYNYVGNRPLVAVDPWGLYYVLQTVTVNKDHSLEYHDEFTVVSDNIVNAGSKSVISWIPYVGDPIADNKDPLLLETYFDSTARIPGNTYKVVVGGTSYTANDFSIDGIANYLYEAAEEEAWDKIYDAATEATKDILGNVVNDAASFIDIGDKINNAGNGLDLVKLDDITFKLIQLNKLPTTYTSLWEAEVSMQLIQEYISLRPEYFYNGFRVSFWGVEEYFFDLDMKIEYFNGPNKCDKIDEMARSYSNLHSGLFTSKEEKQRLYDSAYQVLDGYEDRLKQASFELYTYIKEYEAAINSALQQPTHYTPLDY